MAHVTIVDMRAEFAAEGPDVVLSSRLRDAMTARLARGEQAIVLLNRRGFAHGRLLPPVRRNDGVPELQRDADGAQGGRARALSLLQSLGAAPEGLRQVRRSVPRAARVRHRARRGGSARALSRTPASAESTATRSAGAARSRALLEKFAAKELDVLVGTQMIAKGHDFPSVTLVGVISADVGLGLADFRAAERTFQLLTQVAGRAGRGDPRGRGGGADALSHALQHPARVPAGLSGVLRDELKFRKAMRYPPSVALINVIVKAKTRQGAMDDAAEIAQALRTPGLAPWTRARPGARAARPAERGAPRAAVHQGHAAQRDAQGAADRSGGASGAETPNDRRRGSDERAVDRASLGCQLPTTQRPTPNRLPIPNSPEP